MGNLIASVERLAKEVVTRVMLLILVDIPMDQTMAIFGVRLTSTVTPAVPVPVAFPIVATVAVPVTHNVRLPMGHLCVVLVNVA
jgi:hypothetical protein